MLTDVNQKGRKMKQSDLLKQQASQEENDIKAMGIYKKIVREERAERFENYRDKLLANGFNLTEYEAQGKTTIKPTIYGTVDYFPKANKVLIRSKNKWVPGGLRWIIEELLGS